MKSHLKLFTFVLSVTVCFGQPVATKVFNPSSVFPGGRSTITFDVTNPSTTVTLTGVTFTDNLPGGLVVASPNNINGFCTGGSAGIANGNSGGTTTSLLNTTLVPSSHCTYNIDVIAPATPGTINNTTGPVNSSAGLGTPGTATLTVLQSLLLTKTFGAVSIGAGATTTLTFNLTNPNTGNFAGLGFTDTLPAGLVVATPNGLTGSCGGGTITAVAGSNSIVLAGATLAGGTGCTFAVNVTSTGAVLDLLTNTTSAVTTGGQTVVGAAATASIFIGDPFQVSYFSNLNVADSVINITNTGARGAGNTAGTTANITGSICLNVYGFSPDEQMIACCSCPVTPSGLVSLSLRNDLISNTLTPAVPTSVVVKLVATIPVAGSCTNSAAIVAQAGLSPALAAWGTKIHDAAGVLGLTETAFTAATLSATELARLSSLCSFINANGSGFGICRSCRLGGLGAASGR